MIAVPKDSDGIPQVFLSIVGLLIVAGLAIYDQRNTQIYDRLVVRAKYLEKLLKFNPICDHEKHGGAFQNRPPRRKFFGLIDVIWHNLGLSIVYSICLGVWIYLICSGLIKSGIIYKIELLPSFVALGVIIISLRHLKY